MKKVAIIGSPGAGKSTLSRKLGEILKIPVVHLDAHYWSDGWVETPKEAWKDSIEKFVKIEQWIIDGNYGDTIDIRLEAADTIIFLDIPRIRCIKNAFKRYLRYRHEDRPDMAKGCKEKLDPQFFKYIWFFNGKNRNSILTRLDKLKDKKTIYIFRSYEIIDEFLKSIEREP